MNKDDLARLRAGDPLLVEQIADDFNEQVAERNRIRGLVNPSKRLKKEDLFLHRAALITELRERAGAVSANYVLREMERKWPLKT